MLFNTFERELAVFVKSYPFIYTLWEYISPSERLFFPFLTTTHKNKERAYTGFILALCGSLDSKHNGVGYHLSFEDGRDDPDGAQHPDGSHRQGTVGSSPDGRVNL